MPWYMMNYISTRTPGSWWFTGYNILQFKVYYHADCICAYMHLTISTLKISQGLTAAFQTHFSTFSHTHTHTHTGGHARTHLYICVSVFKFIFIFIYIYVCVCVCLYSHMRISRISRKPHHHRGVFSCAFLSFSVTTCYYHYHLLPGQKQKLLHNYFCFHRPWV